MNDDAFFNRFFRQVSNLSNKIALISDAGKFTYEEVDKCTYNISLHLKEMGIGPECVVVINMPRSHYSVLATIGCLRAGAAYLPLNIGTPTNRKSAMFNISTPKLIISSREGDAFSDMDIPVVYIEDILYSSQTDEVSHVLPLVHPSSLAYVIFTSGSSGTPKGTMVEHGALLNHLNAEIGLMKLDEETVMAHNAPLGFDISVWQVLVGFYIGGTTVVFSDTALTNMNQFINLLSVHKVSILEAVPSFINLLLANSDEKKDKFQSLKYLMSTGEPLNEALACKWITQFPNIPIVNAYGLTEVADDIMHYVMTEKKEGNVPIGLPISNIGIRVLNEKGALCKANEPGELWVSGACLARGYIGDEAETLKRFVYDENGSRFFKTGDLVSQRVDGNFIYHGRIDNQIKHTGKRIELEEIETQMIKTEFAQACASAYDKEKGRIVACYVHETEISFEVWAKALKASLPDYMIPSKYFKVNEIPLSENGKVNRKEIVNMCRDIEANIFLDVSMPETQVESDIFKLVCEILKTNDTVSFHCSSNLAEYGFDSISLILLLIEIEKKYQITFNEEVFSIEKLETVHEISEFINEILASK